MKISCIVGLLCIDVQIVCCPFVLFLCFVYRLYLYCYLMTAENKVKLSHSCQSWQISS